MSDESDSLAGLIRSGDSEKISRELYPVVRRMVGSVLRGADPALVSSATHDALLDVCRYHSTFRGASKASTWLYTVARRAAIRRARKERPPEREVLVEEVGSREVAVSPSYLASTDALALLARAVPNPTWRRIWLLSNEPGADRSHEDVARLTGYTIGSVAVTLSKIRRRISESVQFA